jgi:hypothetical protein
MSQEIRETVSLIQKIINTDSYLIMRNNDKTFYFDKVSKLFPSFAEQYPILFKKIIYHEDLSMLGPMLNSIDDVVEGKNAKEITKNLSEQIAEKYLYPTIGKPVLPPEEAPSK